MASNVKKLALVLNEANKTNRAINRAAGKSISSINKINAITVNSRTNRLLNALKFKNPIKLAHGIF